ncbi:carbonic anhydrase 1-like isoform X3 [Stegodyphus dumicola]|uniref:carbonic anhydrase 1-like isoform X3 n=1 Tax=Stegodyphus dumicola TaxID=202533 RepID=UPI0015B09FBD|nr:carbonic anhydrase 1-like isoform X3 [Stegodyphus dumicola]
MQTILRIFRSVSFPVVSRTAIPKSRLHFRTTSACFLSRSHSFTPKRRHDCILPDCVWPSNLPPATEWGYGKIELCGGPLLHTYELVQFHCHWGSSYSCGSEHTIDGKSYAGELHFVHWNKETFPTCADAIPSAEGLSVVAVFLQEGEMNSEIEKLCEVIPSILEKDQRVNLENDINPESLFPSEHSYWTYSGSLTTPPCYESVTWIIFKNPITVSAEQLNCFRQMKNARCDVNSESSGLVEHNYRPPQSLNDRVIFESVC